MRKGYGDEYRTKQMLVEQYGKDNVIKVAIGSFGADFLILNKGKLLKVVEVKGTRKNIIKAFPQVPEKVIDEVLDFLCKFDFLKREGSKYKITEFGKKFLKLPVEGGDEFNAN